MGFNRNSLQVSASSLAWLILAVIVISILSVALLSFGATSSAAINQQSLASQNRRALMQEIKQVSLQVVDGLFSRVENQKLYVVVGIDSRDTEKKIYEEIELGKIRAVYLIQGNRETLMRYVFGGAGLGSVSGLSSFFLKNKALQEGEGDPMISREAVLWTSVGATVGAVIGYLWGRGVEDVRMMPVFDREIEQTEAKYGMDYHNIENLKKISEGRFIHVVIGHSSRE